MKENPFWKIAQFFEIRWWRKYLSGKDKSEYYSGKRKYWLGVIEKLKPEVSVSAHDRILDAGCGPAGIFTAFAENPVVAVDPLLEKYNSLDHFNPAEFPNTIFVNAPIEEYNSPDSFDFIFCLNVINHVNELGRAIENLAGMLSPDGKLILSVDVHKSNFAAGIFRTLKFDVLHPHQFTAGQYSELIKSIGGLEQIKRLTLKPGKIFDYEIFVFEKKS